MNQYLPRVILLGLLASATTAVAQTDLSYLFTSRPKYWFSASLNVRSGGGNVRFDHLGSLPRNIIDTVNNVVDYDDGAVSSDGQRPDETATSTQPYVDPKTGLARYRTFGVLPDGTTGQLGDFLAFKDGVTRYWQANNQSQLQTAADGTETIDFHSYGAFEEPSSPGSSADIKGKSSAGVDLQLSRDFGTIGKSGGWGITFSLGINDLSAQTSRSALVTGLRILTERYTVNGTLPVATDGTSLPYTAPLVTEFQSTAGPIDQTTIPNSGGYEDTVTLSQQPNTEGSGLSTVTDGAVVSGTWKLKGAYYLMRLGPSVRFFLSKRFSVSANAGLASAIVGSDFSMSETLVQPVLLNQPVYNASSRKTEFKTGAYGEVNLEYWVTFRTGFFAGVVYEHLGKYTQTFNDATATVDIGSGTNFRLGIITRF